MSLFDRLGRMMRDLARQPPGAHDLRAKEGAAQRLAAELTKPLKAVARADGVIHCDDEFYPWALFPAVYGVYSEEFDLCALDVLEELRANKKTRDDLGAEMFREMLCRQDFCDYGTSPRVCFWALDVSLLDDLLLKWREWSWTEWHEGDD